MQCDIIIPVWDQLALTRDCIDSIFKYTDIDYRIIIIDNASGEETKHYLEGLKVSKGESIILARNDENTGFIKAVNKGISLSAAPYVCILNNDTLVTKGWLKEMIDVADAVKTIGIVNPSSNNLGQKPGRDESIDDYAQKLSSSRGKFSELGACVGFCMLIKRELLGRIGAFDEIYGMGNFEDTDFSRRAAKEGYSCVRACGAYVYHRESSSFGRIKTFEDDFKRNREIFEFRWGRTKRVAYIVDSFDGNLLKRLYIESLHLARDGNWVWYFSKEHIDIPEHSNIIMVELPHKGFYPKAIFRILKKKKKFDEISVGNEKLGNILERLSFIHKAKINYY